MQNSVESPFLLRKLNDLCAFFTKHLVNSTFLITFAEDLKIQDKATVFEIPHKKSSYLLNSQKDRRTTVSSCLTDVSIGGISVYLRG